MQQLKHIIFQNLLNEPRYIHWELFILNNNFQVSGKSIIVLFSNLSRIGNWKIFVKKTKKLDIMSYYGHYLMK